VSTTHTYTTYKFDELSPASKAKALDANRYINVEYIDWWDQTYADASAIGLKITSFYLDRNLHAEGEFEPGYSAKDVALAITKDHGKDCMTHVIASAYLDECALLENLKDYDEYTLEGLDQDFLRDLLKAYARMLQDESEYLCSDEALTEYLTDTVMEYEFTVNGEIDY
jgi:hypothetical protein